MAPGKKTKRHMGDAAFGQLVESLEQARDPARGRRADLRTTLLSVPGPPPPMKKTQVVAIRDSMGCSQSRFAKALNVSKRTVESWEQGLREPGDAALRLLQIAKEQPSVLITVGEPDRKVRRPAGVAAKTIRPMKKRKKS